MIVSYYVLPVNNFEYSQKQKAATRKLFPMLPLFFVEPTGLEPVSKHIRRKLSTCLFTHYLSGKCRSATNQYFP